MKQVKEVTEFGKLLRKIRIDNDETLNDMGKRIGICGTTLSMIELGKRKIPSGLSNKIIKIYNIDDRSLLLAEIMSNLKDREKEALSELTQAIYFNDSHLYSSALMRATCKLLELDDTFLSDQEIKDIVYQLDPSMKN